MKIENGHAVFSYALGNRIKVKDGDILIDGDSLYNIENDIIDLPRLKYKGHNIIATIGFNLDGVPEVVFKAGYRIAQMSREQIEHSLDGMFEKEVIQSIADSILSGYEDKLPDELRLPVKIDCKECDGWCVECDSMSYELKTSSRLYFNAYVAIMKTFK